MLKVFRIGLIATVLLVGLSTFAQTIPCRAGTMADIVGTSCSIGSVIFNFQNDFHGGAVNFTSDNVTSIPITPVDVGFIPIQSGNQAGFKLVLNFADGPGDSTSSSSHFLQFSYTPQAAPGAEIRVQNLAMDAHAQGAPLSTAFVQILDFQNYANSGFLATDTALDNEQGTSVFNQLTDNQILEVPSLVSTGSGFPGASTTQIFDFITGAASASLTSATFLYTTGPIVPAPGLASLSYTNIDLPGVAATFVSNITNSGDTVGTYQDLAGNFHGYIADPQGNFITVDVPGATATFGGGLNQHGDMVGSFTDATGDHGFVRHNGVITTVDVPGSIFTAAIAINNKGQIGGEYESSDRGFHGFVLDDGVFATIDHGPGTGLFASTGVFGINDSSEIAGFFFDPNTFRSFTQKKNAVQFIDVPGQGDTIIDGINDPGDSVGTYNDFNLVQHGFVLSGQTFQTVDFPDGSNTVPLGINASGKIVGIYRDAAGNQHSFLAQAAPDGGHEHQPRTSPAMAPQSRPDCRDEQWNRQRARLRNTGGCQQKH